MRRILRHRPSPALVVACLALTIALGGTSYAAVTLPRNSVGTPQLSGMRSIPQRLRTVHSWGSTSKGASSLGARGVDRRHRPHRPHRPTGSARCARPQGSGLHRRHDAAAGPDRDRVVCRLGRRWRLHGRRGQLPGSAQRRHPGCERAFSCVQCADGELPRCGKCGGRTSLRLRKIRRCQDSRRRVQPHHWEFGERLEPRLRDLL